MKARECEEELESLSKKAKVSLEKLKILIQSMEKKEFDSFKNGKAPLGSPSKLIWKEILEKIESLEDPLQQLENESQQIESRRNTIKNSVNSFQNSIRQNKEEIRKRQEEIQQLEIKLNQSNEEDQKLQKRKQEILQLKSKQIFKKKDLVSVASEFKKMEETLISRLKNAVSQSNCLKSGKDAKQDEACLPHFLNVCGASQDSIMKLFEFNGEEFLKMGEEDFKDFGIGKKEFGKLNYSISFLSQSCFPGPDHDDVCPICSTCSGNLENLINEHGLYYDEKFKGIHGRDLLYYPLKELKPNNLLNSKKTILKFRKLHEDSMK